MRKRQIIRPDAVSMRTTEREKEILRLETERRRVNLEIEKLLSDYVRVSGDKSMKPKRARGDRAPNDFNYKKV